MIMRPNTVIATTEQQEGVSNDVLVVRPNTAITITELNEGLKLLSSTELYNHVACSWTNTVDTVTQFTSHYTGTTKTNIDARHSDGTPRDQLGAAGGWTDGKAISNGLVCPTVCGSLVDATRVTRQILGNGSRVPPVVGTVQVRYDGPQPLKHLHSS